MLSKKHRALSSGKGWHQNKLPIFSPRYKVTLKALKTIFQRMCPQFEVLMICLKSNQPIVSKLKTKKTWNTDHHWRPVSRKSDVLCKNAPQCMPWEWQSYFGQNNLFIAFHVRKAKASVSGIVDKKTIFLWYMKYHRSYVRNLSSCEKKAWNKFRLERDSSP